MKKHLLLAAILLSVLSNLSAQHFVRAIESKTHYLNTDVQSMGSQGSLVTGAYTDSATMLIYYFISRYDNTGHLIWAKEFGPKPYYLDGGAKATSDGNFIVTHHLDDSTCVIYKLNSTGSVTWCKSFRVSSNFSVVAVRELSNGNYLVAGSYDLSFTETHVYMMQVTAASGSLVSFKGFRCEEGEVSLRDVIQTNDGNLLLTGEVQNPGFSHDIYLLKTSLTNTVLWSQRISIDTTGIYPQHLFETGSGTIQIVAGSAASFSGMSDAFVITTGSTGSFQSAKGIDVAGSNLTIVNSNKTADGSMLFVGNDYGNISMVAMKMDANGNAAFTKEYNIGNLDLVSSITELQGGDLLIGATTNEFDFNRGGGLLEMTLLRTDAGGSLSCFTTNSSSTVYNRTFTSSALSFVDTAVGSLQAGSINTLSVYVDSVLCGILPSGIDEAERNIAFTIYPNPVSSEVMVTCAEKMEEIKVTDAIGKEIFQSEIANTTTFKLHTTSFPAGIYFVQVKAGKGYSAQRFIKE